MMQTLQFSNHSIYWYLGWILIPAALILSMMEFFVSLVICEEARTEFYFVKSLGWFVSLGENNKENKI